MTDNQSSHKVAGVGEAIEAAAVRSIFLPPYSPGLNPTETVFSKFKWIIRSMKERTTAALQILAGAATHNRDAI